MKVVAIIPAAGLGTRMSPASDAKGKRPAASKQFSELGGTPILIHTLRKFAGCGEVAEIYLALRANEIAGFRPRLQQESKNLPAKKIELVEGGEHRQQSVAHALAAVSAEPDDIVLVHDAVRPFVTEDIIHEVIQAARKYGAAIAGMPAMDTVKQVERTAEGALIAATVPRGRVGMAQTPQGVRERVVKRAFGEAAADEKLRKEHASLLKITKPTVAVVMGSSRNIKITTPADMELAEFFLKR